VDDVTLKRILMMFDAMAFDAEARSWVEHGFGLQGPASRNAYALEAGWLSVGITDRQARIRNDAIFPPNPVQEFIRTQHARGMVLRPYVDVQTIEFSDDEAALVALLEVTAIDYFMDVLYENKTVGESWDGYMDMLNRNGLHAYMGMLGD
jgi:hypothetical protein